MATTREQNGEPGTKTAVGRHIYGLADPEFKKDHWVVFLSEDHDGWIRGKVKEVRRNMYVPNDYVIHFTERLSIQVM